MNIGGLPFLPSETHMVSDFLDELIEDSPSSAFERATLPQGIEERLAKVDWDLREVMIGFVRNDDQMQRCLDGKKVLFEDGMIHLIENGQETDHCLIRDFAQRPNAVFRRLMRHGC